MDKFYLLIVGSRTYDDYSEFKNVVNLALKNIKIPIVIVSGGANGTDAMAKVYANEYEYEYIEFLADWKKYSTAAGYIRNKEMHDFISKEKNKGCLAFWDGKSKGTSHSFELAKKYKNPIRIYNFLKKDFTKGE